MYVYISLVYRGVTSTRDESWSFYPVQSLRGVFLCCVVLCCLVGEVGDVSYLGKCQTIRAISYLLKAGQEESCGWQVGGPTYDDN